MKKMNVLPYVWKTNNDNPLEITKIFQNELNEVLKILNLYGAILFKGGNISDSEKLDACISNFPGARLNYFDGNSPRRKIINKVYTSTEHPAELLIPLHNELSYSKNWPLYLFFCCETAPLIGGSTTLGDSRKIIEDMPDDLLNDFRAKGVCYIRNLHNGLGVGKSWKETFETDEISNVEEYCRNNDIQIEVSGDGSIKLTQFAPGTIAHPVTGEEVWFNQADQFHPTTNPPEIFEALQDFYGESFHEMPQYACFGDGDPIPLEYLNIIRNVLKKNTVFFTWERGDLLLADNMRVCHGRDTFEGERKILVSMVR
ncbi:TauD/TfdA family dioxygenase [Sphingobacterium kitahiroshimense]|uniref:TauD/TfdA family dioxygenase n=1 Tax=Sphingobacterium kitahiroshimense TaxID=470446 RepID=A0ABV0BUQ7_9SPHI